MRRPLINEPMLGMLQVSRMTTRRRPWQAAYVRIPIEPMPPEIQAAIEARQWDEPPKP